MNQFFASTLETLLNQALRLDPPSLSGLNKLAGKIIRIELSGIDLNFTLFPDNQGIIILGEYEGEVDVCICGAPFTLLQMMRQSEPTVVNNPNVTINGDINSAQQLVSLLKGLEIDWEEQVAQWLGDIPTHHLGTLFRQSQEYIRGRYDSLQLNLSEYLQEEARYLPTPVEIDNFLNDVDILRDDMERLTQRVQRLQKQLTIEK